MSDSGVKITFRFSGGPLDGKVVVGDERHPGEACRYYALSYGGQIGQRFRVASDYAVNTLAREMLQVETPHRFQEHRYEVIDHFELAGRVLIRARYV